jgi:hypothetical protein
VADDRPLPVQPFLRCAEDATARAGTPNLSAVQVLLPVQGIDPASRPPYGPCRRCGRRSGCAECAPEARTLVEVNINSGRDPSIPAVAQQLTDHLGHLDQDVFACRSHDVGRPGRRCPSSVRRPCVERARPCTAWCCAESLPSGRVTRSGGRLRSSPTPSPSSAFVRRCCSPSRESSRRAGRDHRCGGRRGDSRVRSPRYPGEDVGERASAVPAWPARSVLWGD